jgi:uncharacterized membrane protein YoaK (UPF0700 family)
MDLPLVVSIRRVVAFGLVAGYVEVIAFLDLGGIYPGVMTGNTVQLGLTFARNQWARFEILALAVSLFFIGGLVASLIKRHLRQPSLGLLIMAALLLAASVIRLHAHAHVPAELAVLALALAIQGETVSTFGGVSLQTIVVTSNILKFADALVGRYMTGLGGAALKDQSRHTGLKEVMLPSLAWLSYSIGAGGGATAAGLLRVPLLIPAVVLVFTVGDLMATGKC